MGISNPIFSFYYNLEGACLTLQQKVFGRFMNEMWAYRILDITTGLIAILVMYLLQRYVLTSMLFSIILGMSVFLPLLLYYMRKVSSRESVEEKIRAFDNKPIVWRTVYLAYVVTVFIFLPISLLALVIFHNGR